MFRDSKAYSGFAVPDLEAAREFYGRTLGLDVRESHGMLELHLATGAAVLVYPKEDHEAATYTILNFPVRDVDAAVDELTRRGVRMEHYEYPDMQTDERGVMRGFGPPIAWFRDPAGNILSVIESEDG